MGQATQILVIDDEEDVIFLVSKRLRANGYEVASLDKGKNALEVIRQNPPHLILLDIWLPGISGREIFSKLKKDANLAHIPVIFFSADASQEKVCLEELGAEGFLKKPYDNARMLELINSLVPKQSLA